MCDRDRTPCYYRNRKCDSQSNILKQYAIYQDAGFQSLLPKLIPEIEKVAKNKSSSQKVAVPEHAGLSVVPSGKASDEPLKQDDFVSYALQSTP